MAFYQDGPELGNTYTTDAALLAALDRRLSSTVRDAWEPGLHKLGGLAAGEMLELAARAEAEPPQHVPYAPWGRRIDEIRVSDAWRRLHAIAAEEGVVATAFERADGEWSRLHQMLRLYLYHPSSAICSCPMAMTDGAARTLELFAPDTLREALLPRLLSRDPDRFWTAGQWMTERSGGSDVSGTGTVARAEGDGYRLYGDKWFTSATTSELAVTLARIERDGKRDEGLSLFLVRVRDANGQLQGIRLNRLKDKLGTRALPTAELTLDGAHGELLGEPGRGVRQISTVLNITRAYNACCAASSLGRGLALARDYAGRRSAFGKPLDQQPLHVDTLDRIDTEYRAAMLLVLELAELLGRSEAGQASAEQEMLLRILTPIAKLYTAKQAVAGISEVLECFGGAGYVEDTGLPAMLRDVQVLSIWEGTTNVLSLDLLRALARPEAGAVLAGALTARLEVIECGTLHAQRDRLEQWLLALKRRLAEAPGPAGARDLAYAAARCLCGVLLIEQAAWADTQGHSDANAAVRAAQQWVDSGGMPLAQPSGFTA